MRTRAIIIIGMLMCSMAQSQTKPMVENYPLKTMDLVIIPFGMEYPVNIGTISDAGELIFKFPSDLPVIPEDIKENFITSIVSSLFSKCDNIFDYYDLYDDIKTSGGGYISLSSKENPYQGLFFMTTDENLVPWLEDSYSGSAVVASYFELIFMHSDFDYQDTCTNTFSKTEDETIETVYVYDLKLKKGFNFIEYKIESIEQHMMPSAYDETVFDKIDKPTKITVTSSQSSVPNTKWIGKYF